MWKALTSLSYSAWEVIRVFKNLLIAIIILTLSYFMLLSNLIAIFFVPSTILFLLFLGIFLYCTRHYFMNYIFFCFLLLPNSIILASTALSQQFFLFYCSFFLFVFAFSWHMLSFASFISRHISIYFRLIVLSLLFWRYFLYFTLKRLIEKCIPSHFQVIYFSILLFLSFLSLSDLLFSSVS